MSSYPVLAAWAFAAGALIPVMGSLNANLSRALGGAPNAMLVLFTVAVAASGLTVLLSPQSLPTVAQATSAPARLYLGGFIVAFYVFSVTVLVPQFGVGNTILFAMTAQIVTSALMDHYGLFGAPLRPVGLVRLAGIGLMLAGLFIAQASVTRAP